MRVTPEEYKQLLKKKPQSAASKKAANNSQSNTDFFAMLCVKDGLPEPIKEVRFAKDIGREWRSDLFFEYAGRRVAVEKEGGIRSGGRHTNPDGFIDDMQKYNAYSMLGIFLLRFSTEQIEKESGKCIDIIKSVLFKSKSLAEMTKLVKKKQKRKKITIKES